MFTRALLIVGVVGLTTSAHDVVGAADVEEKEAPESAVSSPPMEMDDPGTPGSQGIEVNLVGTLSRVGRGRGSETLLDANYGIGDRLQLKLERPYMTQDGAGLRFQRGLGSTEIGIKWRFAERNGWELAAYPQYGFDDAFTLEDEEGNPEDKVGRSAYFPLLISKRIGRAYTLGSNVGYRRNLENRGDDVILALGAGRSLGEGARILTELFSERDGHLANRQTDIRVGYVGALFPKWLSKSRFELGGFVSIGHSIGLTEEGEPSTSFTFGVSVVKKPQVEGQAARADRSQRAWRGGRESAHSHAARARRG